MTDSATPVSDLIERLMSRGISPGDAVEEGRRIEVALARDSASGIRNRERERLKKARQRERKAKKSPGTPDSTISSTDSPKTQTQLKKKDSVERRPRDNSPARVDDWPEAYAELFWAKYPPARKYDKAQVFRLLEKLRAEGFINAEKKRERLAWATLMAGLDQYIRSNPGTYAKAPLPWLRAHRWQWDGGQNGKSTDDGGRGGTDHYAAAAARRFGPASRNGPASRPTDPVQLAGRSGDHRPGTGTGEDSAFDFGVPPRR